MRGRRGILVEQHLQALFDIKGGNGMHEQCTCFPFAISARNVAITKKKLVCSEWGGGGGVVSCASPLQKNWRGLVNSVVDSYQRPGIGAPIRTLCGLLGWLYIVIQLLAQARASQCATF